MRVSGSAVLKMVICLQHFGEGSRLSCFDVKLYVEKPLVCGVSNIDNRGVKEHTRDVSLAVSVEQEELSIECKNLNVSTMSY